jgi:hypothetical protein
LFLELLNRLPQSEFGTAARIIILCTIVFLAGRAAVALFWAPNRHAEAAAADRVGKNPGYLAAANGATVLFLLTWALRLFHLYSFASLIISLLFAILLALLFSKDFRAAFCGWRRPCFSVTWMYIGSALAFWVALSPEEYPVKGTSLYLLEGFHLFSNLDAATFPHYGTLFVPPVFDAEPAIAAVFALFSYGNHFLYYAYGEYWLNLLIAPLIPIGAYLFFRRFASSWLSVLAAVSFCIIVLEFKVWSLRGESLAWILGFAFLMLLADFLSAFDRRQSTGWAFRYLTGMAFLFLVLSLMHGIVMLIAFTLGAGLTLRFMLAQTSVKRAGTLAALMLFSAVVFVAAYSGFSATQSGTVTIKADIPPPAGEPDAAVEYHRAYLNLPPDTDAPLVLPYPPYISRMNIAGISAILLPASVGRHTYFEIGDFPGDAVRALHALPFLESATYVGVFLSCCIFFVGFPSAASLRSQALFWGAACTYLSLIVLAVYLDSISVSAFPLTAIRRTYPYSCFFYWVSVATGVATIISSVLKRPIYDAEAAMRNAWYRRASAALNAKISKQIKNWIGNESLARLYAVDGLSAPRLRRIFVASLVPLWFVYSMNGVEDYPWNVSRLGHRIFHRLREVALPSPANPPFTLMLKPLFDTVAFVIDRTSHGELVYSNVISEGVFWYLSSGRLSLFDGTNMYQFYFLQRDATRRMRRFADFATTANMEDVAGYDFKYLVLYKRAECDAICYGDVVVPTDFGRFAGNPLFRLLFDNSAYSVFERTDISAGASRWPAASAGNPRK